MKRYLQICQINFHENIIFENQLTNYFLKI